MAPFEGSCHGVLVTEGLFDLPKSILTVGSSVLGGLAWEKRYKDTYN